MWIYIYINSLKEAHDKIKKERPAKISDKAKLCGMGITPPLSVAKYALDVICELL